MYSTSMTDPAVDADADGVEADLGRSGGGRGARPSRRWPSRRIRRCLRRSTARTGRSGPKAAPSRPALTSTKTSVAAVAGDDVELAVAGAGVALDDLPAGGAQAAGDELLGRSGRCGGGRSVIACATQVGLAVEHSARHRRDRIRYVQRSHAFGLSLHSVVTVLATARTFTLDGIAARPVRVEVDVHRGLPGFAIVGLPDAAVREARERVRAALVNCGFEFPLRRIVVNLAPASLRKAGPGMDLAIAAALLERLRAARVGGAVAASRWPASWRSTARSGRSTAPWRSPRRPGRRCAEAIVLPAENGARGGAGAGDRGVRARQPQPPAGAGRGGVGAVAAASRCRWSSGAVAGAPDLADLRGQPHLRHALEVAAAGGHSLLMIGPPGAGKSLAARRLPSILPPLAPVEALEVARIASACGRLTGAPTGRPALPRAAPHDQPRRPGRRRQPASSGRGDAGPSRRPLPRRALRVPPRLAGGAARRRWRRARSRSRGPALSAACPAASCWSPPPIPAPAVAAKPIRECSCAPAAVQRYQGRLSGALADRIDILAAVHQPSAAEIGGAPGEPSADVRERVDGGPRAPGATARTRGAATPR